MLTAENVAKMDREAKAQLFERLGQAYIGRKTFHGELAKRMGKGASTLHNWSGRLFDVPTEVLLLLDVWVGGVGPQKPDFEVVSQEILEAAKHLQKGMNALAKLAANHLDD